MNVTYEEEPQCYFHLVKNKNLEIDMKVIFTLSFATLLGACTTTARNDDPPPCANQYVYKTVDAGQAYYDFEQDLVGTGDFYSMTPLELDADFEISYCQNNPRPQANAWRIFGNLAPAIRTDNCRRLPSSGPVNRPVSSAANGVKIEYMGCPRAVQTDRVR